jgi:hypothetical protein
VAFVADQQDVVVVGGESPGLVVHLRDEGARRVDGAQIAFASLVVDLGRDPVRGEHDSGTLGHFFVLVNEDRALRLQRRDDVLVVDDLLTHVDGRVVELQRLFDCLHRPVDSCAVAARLRQQHPLRRFTHEPHGTGASTVPGHGA